MATSREEIKVVLGIDQTSLTNGLRGASGKITSFAGEVKSAFAGLGATIAAAFTFNAALNQLKSLSDYVQGIKATAEQTGLPTDFVQDLTNVAKSAGIAGESVSKMMGAFTARLQPGDDPQEKLYELADRMAAIDDPAARAKLAIDAFGQSGLKMIPILAQGRDALKEMGDEFGHISESQIALIDDANLVLDKATSKIRVWTATAIESLAFLAKGIKELPQHPFSPQGAKDAFANALFGSMPQSQPKAVEADQRKASAEAMKHNQMVAEGLKAQAMYEAKLKDISYQRADTAGKILLDTTDLLKARRDLALMDQDTPEAKRFEKLQQIAELEFKIDDLRKKQSKENSAGAAKKGQTLTMSDAAAAAKAGPSTVPDRFSLPGLQAQTHLRSLAEARRNGDLAHIPGLEKLVKSYGIDPATSTPWKFNRLNQIENIGALADGNQPDKAGAQKDLTQDVAAALLRLMQDPQGLAVIVKNIDQ